MMSIEGHLIARNSTFIDGNAYQGGAIYTWMWGVIEAFDCTEITIHLIDGMASNIPSHIH